MIENNYDKIVGRLINVIRLYQKKIKQDKCIELRGDDVGIVDTAVLFEGSLQTRGYSSLNGVFTTYACKCFLLKEPLKS